MSGPWSRWRRRPPAPAVIELFAKAARLSANQHFKPSIKCLREALAIAPDDIPCLAAMGMAVAMDGRPAEAESWFRRVIEIEPGIAEAHLNLGNCLREQHRDDEALAAYNRAVTINPRSLVANFNLAQLLEKLERLHEAETSYRWILTMAPDDRRTLNALGLLLIRMARHTEAEPVLRRAIELDPEEASAHINLGVALDKLSRLPEALECHRRALAINPKSVEAHLNMSNVLMGMNALDEAISHAQRALVLRQDYIPAMVNLGAAETFKSNYPESERWFRTALALDPSNVMAHWNLANILLRNGDFANGFLEYEWRWRWPEFSSEPRNFTQPLWHPGMPKDTRVLLHAEQGWGDSIQFLRFVPEVIALGYEVILEIQPPLARLARFQNFCPVVAKGETLPEFDAQCPLWTLALQLGTTMETIPSAPPYLKADPAEIARWKAHRDERLTIGLVWAGKPKPDPLRSIGLMQMLPLLDLPGIRPGIRFVSLQKDLQAGDSELMAELDGRLEPWADDFNDFADTAAALSALDLVISIDTGVAHLAGAMNIPVWVMIRHSADWRWFIDREDNPWYPSARIFRQSAILDWVSVTDKIKPELLRLATGDRSALIPMDKTNNSRSAGPI